MPVRPQYHVAPRQGGWINDPNGPFFYRGLWHLFYQYLPGSSKWDWGLMWGHAVSSDQVHWKELPPALTPTPGSADQDGVFSGCACIDESTGVPYLLYTGVTLRSSPSCGPLPPAECDLNLPFIECQLIAWPEDVADPLLKVWCKSHVPLIPLPPPHLNLTGWRDPFIAATPSSTANKRYIMLLGGGIKQAASGLVKPGYGAALMYSSEQLHGGWDYDGILCSGISQPPSTGAVWECPILASLPLLPAMTGRNQTSNMGQLDAVGACPLSAEHASDVWRRTVFNSNCAVPLQASDLSQQTYIAGLKCSNATLRDDGSISAEEPVGKALQVSFSHNARSMDPASMHQTQNSAPQQKSPRCPAFTTLWPHNTSENTENHNPNSSGENEEEALFFCISPDACTNPTLYWIGKHTAANVACGSSSVTPVASHLGALSEVSTPNFNEFSVAPCNGNSGGGGSAPDQAEHCTLSAEVMTGIAPAQQEEGCKLGIDIQDLHILLGPVTDLGSSEPEATCSERYGEEVTVLKESAELLGEAGTQAGAACEVFKSNGSALPFSLGSAYGPFQLDMGDILYAPNVVKDPQGRTILMAWMQERRKVGSYDYAGCLSIPRVLSISQTKPGQTSRSTNSSSPSLYLFQEPLPELRKLRNNERCFLLKTCQEHQPLSAPQVHTQHCRSDGSDETATGGAQNKLLGSCRPLIIANGVMLPIPVVSGTFLDIVVTFKPVSEGHAIPSNQLHAQRVPAVAASSASSHHWHRNDCSTSSNAVAYQHDTCYTRKDTDALQRQCGLWATEQSREEGHKSTVCLLEELQSAAQTNERDQITGREMELQQSPNAELMSGLLLKSWLSGQDGSAVLLFNWSSNRLEVIFEALDPITHNFCLTAPNARRVGGALTHPPCDGEPLHLRVLIDASLLEVFTQAGEVLSTRVYRGEPSNKDHGGAQFLQKGHKAVDTCGVSLVSFGGSTEVLRLEAYEMNQAWHS